VVTRSGASLLLALLLAAASPGCSKAEEPAAGDGAAGEIPGDEVHLVRTFPPSTSGGLPAPARTVVRDAAAWAALWAKANANMAPVPKEPAVDFAKEMVAVAALGERRSAGYSVEIVGARRDAGTIRILVAEREPPAGAVVAQVITAPWHAVVLPRSDDPVLWEKYEAPR